MNFFERVQDNIQEGGEGTVGTIWSIVFDIAEMLIGRVIYRMAASAHKLLPFLPFRVRNRIADVLALIWWSAPIWVASGIAWYYWGFAFWDSVWLAALAVWLFSRFQPE